MFKRSVLFVLLVAILSSVPSAVWAQKTPLVKKGFSVREVLPKNKHFLKTTPVLREQNPRILMGETSLREKQIRTRCLQKAQQIQQRIYEEEIARHPPVIGKKVQANAAKLLFRGKKIGVLKRGEHIVMGAAYDSHKRLVAQLQGTLPNGQPLLSTQLETALQGYDIESIMLLIRFEATPKKRAQSRLLTYRVSTGEVIEKIIPPRKVAP